jgi:hypothetical protein
MAYVYRHIRLDKNMPFYIGISADENYTRAYNRLDRNDIWRRIAGKSDIEVEILFDEISIEFAKTKEKELIALYGRLDLETGSLANLTDGGDGTFQLSKETIAKMISNRTGVKHPRHKGRIYCFEPDGTLTEVFECVRDAAAKLNTTCNMIRRVASGERRMFKNKIFSYKKESPEARKIIDKSEKAVVHTVTGEVFSNIRLAADYLKIKARALHHNLNRNQVNKYPIKYL